MAELKYPIINGHEVSWSSIRSTLGGIPLPGLTAINYSSKTDAQAVRGQGRHVLGATAGNVEHSSDAEMLEKDWNFLMATRLGPNGFGERFITTTVSYVEDGQIPVTDVITHRVIGVEKARSQGSEPAKVKLTFITTDIKYNLIGKIAPDTVPL